MDGPAPGDVAQVGAATWVEKVLPRSDEAVLDDGPLAQCQPSDVAPITSSCGDTGGPGPVPSSGEGGEEPDRPITVEVDLGSASSWGRPPDRTWMVRLRRAERSVIVTVGLSRMAAEHLADHITEVLEPQPDHRQGRGSSMHRQGGA